VRLLERERELSYCAAALERAKAGTGSVVVVEGPPGIGKTELLQAVRRRCRGAVRVLAARGLEVEREVAFGGVKQLLEPVLRLTPQSEARELLSGAATPARRILADANDGTAQQPTAEFSVLNALYWVIARLADTAPLLVVVDDAHWLDPPSLRFLDFLTPRVEEFRALLLVAMRALEAESDDPACRRIVADPASTVVRPDRLSRAAVAEMVRSRLGVDAHPAFIDACSEVTVGNPFYLVELIREVKVRQACPDATGAELVRTIGPRSISLALRVRAAGSSDRIAVARGLAVLGDGARLDHIAAMADLDVETAARAVDALVGQSILTPDPTPSFVHPILRTAVYSDIPPHQRSIMHLRAARLLQSAAGPVHHVAAHLMQTSPSGSNWVVQHLRSAAAEALNQGAPDSARRYLRRALREPPDIDVRAHVLIELGRAEATTADPDAIEHLLEAYNAATDWTTRAQAAQAAAYPFAAAGRVTEAIGMLADAVERLAGEDQDLALALEAQLVAFAMAEPAAGAPHRARLDRICEEDLGDSLGARMLLCHVAYRRMWRSTDAMSTAELVQRALGDGDLIVKLGPEATELNSAAITLICADWLDPAERLLDTALALTRERGSLTGFAHVSFLRSAVAHRRGEMRDVEAEANSARSAFHDLQRLGVAVAVGMLISALIERGALNEAAGALSAVGFASGPLPTQAPLNLLLSSRGRLRLASGDIDGGLDDLLECGRRNELVELRNPVVVPWRIEAALAHRDRGEIDAAMALARDEYAAAEDWGTPAAIGTAQRLMGLLSPSDHGIDLLREAVTALAESPARLEYARALVDLGAALRRANHRSDTREPLLHGLDLADRCGATVLRDRARDELAAMGVHPRRIRLTGVDALTASERRVAQMAACGASNLSMAQQLFVTRKTIEKHLRNAYRKLGVKSRAQLAARLSEAERRDL
jgi:DNA-binding CsgD family transcriptional regulator